MKIGNCIVRPGDNLPRRFHSQGDKDVEIGRLEGLLDQYRGNPRVKVSVVRLVEQRLRKVRGIVVGQ